MRKILFLLPLIILSCTSSRNNVAHTFPQFHFAGHMEEEEISFLKENYSWPSGELLVINYRQPRSTCHFDNYKIDSKTRFWWKSFYDKIDLENASNIFVYSDAYRVKWQLDSKDHFEDTDEFLLNNFFQRKQSCYGIMVLNEAGDYLQYNGHYSEKQVAAFMEALN